MDTLILAVSWKTIKTVMLMLKKIEYYYFNGEQEDISKLKISWDTQRNQFRAKFYCNHCGNFVDCRCFEELSTAIDQVNSGLVCDNCLFDDCICDIGTDELFYKLDKQRREKAYDYLLDLLNDSEMRELIKNATSDGCDDHLYASEIFDIVHEDERDQALRDFILNLMTAGEKRDIVYDNYDEWATGESCDI